MVSGHLAEVVEEIVVFILARLRPVGAEAQREISVWINEGERAGSRILGNNIEPERRRRRQCGSRRLQFAVIVAEVAAAQFVQRRAIKDVRPRCVE